MNLRQGVPSGFLARSRVHRLTSWVNTRWSLPPTLIVTSSTPGLTAVSWGGTSGYWLRRKSMVLAPPQLRSSSRKPSLRATRAG